jgi:site-specific recombinase XerD
MKKRGLGGLILKRMRRARLRAAGRAHPARRRPKVSFKLPVPSPRRAPARGVTILPPEGAPPRGTAQAPASADLPLLTSMLIRPNPRLQQSIEAFLLDQRSEHTRRAYGKDLKRFVKFLITRNLSRGPESLERGVLIAYKESLVGEGLEHTTIDRHLATLRSFFRWLVDDGVLARSPAEGVRFLNPKRVSRTAGLTDEEVVRLLARPDLHTRTGSLHYAVLMVLFHCGLRRSELCALRTSQATLERGHRLFRLRGKGNAERLIVVVPAVWEALEHYFLMNGKRWERDQPVFTPVRNNRTGVREKPLDASAVFYIVVKYARLAGIQSRVSPHSCRATAISNARDRNVPDRAIQEFAGWASPDMITRYDKRKSALEKSAAHAISYGAEARVKPRLVSKPG